MLVKIVIGSHHVKYGALHEGASIDVDEDTAKRWERYGIAEISGEKKRPRQKKDGDEK